MTDLEALVYGILARELQLPEPELRRRRGEDLGQLGLDSHSLLRVLLEAERALALSSPLELDDAALATPESLVGGIAAHLGQARPAKPG